MGLGESAVRVHAARDEERLELGDAFLYCAHGLLLAMQHHGLGIGGDVFADGGEVATVGTWLETVAFVLCCQYQGAETIH